MGLVKKKNGYFVPTERMRKIANISDEDIYQKAGKNPEKFWARQAQNLDWKKKWTKMYQEKMPYFKWFLDGRINASVNCLDKHVKNNEDNIAIIWEPEPIKEKAQKITYKELYQEVNKLANGLKELNIKKGDRVAIYMPMIPQALVAMLACSRIGAIHNVVFSAFSAKSLKERIKDSQAKLLITGDGYYRKGKEINTIGKARKASENTSIEKIIVYNRLSKNKKFKERNMVCYSNLLKKQKKYCKPVFVESNEPLFLLYTSGTTGKPKGIVHDTGGYLTQAYTTMKWNFDVHGNDVMWCTADIGWITGHTYGCYGPLLNGITTLMYEGAPTYPDEGRWFDIIDKHKVTQFYTAPTAIRMLEQKEKIIKKYNLSSLRLIASVGEPIDEEAWLWYFNKIGKNNHPLIDTWWQTETGGNLINALPGIGPFIPTVAGKSFPGTRHKVLDEEGKEIIDKEGFLVQESPFAPGMLRGVYNNPEKYKEEYWSKFKGKYFTGDKAIMDKNGNIRILGRGDDVMKVAGHRLATAEVENAVDSLDFVEECAVVPKKDRIKGQVPAVFAISEEKGKKAKEKIINAVLKHIGPTAKPKAIYFVGDLPKTRSGKIMRRLIKNVMENKKIRDKSTLKNPDSLNNIKGVVGKN